MASTVTKLILFICALLISVIIASDNGVGITPPMGWNTWCTIGPCETDYCYDGELRSIADAMSTNGMSDLGYTYINMDDCWADYRTSNGTIVADPSRFPYGLKELADYIHSKGLLFGLYTDAGILTCSDGGRNHSIPGSYGYYVQDADTYASWGVDYVKMDWCNTDINGTQLDPRNTYPNMSKALNETKRPIFFDTCEWGVDNPWLWAPQIANGWRIGGDHHDNWSSTSSIIETLVGKAQYAGQGGWNDPDFLMTGGQGCTFNKTTTCPGQTFTEYQTEFAIWCITASPLIIATDIRNMTTQKQSIVLNKEIVAVNQDPLKKAGDRVYTNSCGESSSTTCQVWSKPLANGSYALVLYNSGAATHNITASFSLIGWSGAQATVRDLWAHANLGTFTGSFTAQVPSHGNSMVTVTKA